MFRHSLLVFLTSLITFFKVYGQTTDNRKLINLGSNINSAASEINPHIAPDGKTLYFVREQQDEQLRYQEIYISEMDEKGDWKPAVRMDKPFNTVLSNSVVSVSEEGNELLIKGFYKEGKLKERGFSVTRKNAGTWSQPEGMVVKDYAKMDKGLFNNACLSKGDNVVLFSFSTSRKVLDNDLYVSFLQEDKTYSKPVKLGSNINIENSMEFAPFLSVDDKFLYFASERPGGLGETDIYRSERLDDTWLNWSDPVNLGEKINGPGRDAYYSHDGNSTHAYLVSDKNSLGQADIVMVELEKEKKPLLPERPIFIVKGVIYDANTEQPITATIDYKGEIVAELKGQIISKPDSGNYSITFPGPQNYYLRVHTHGYLEHYDTLEVRNKGDFFEITRNYYLTPITKGEIVVLQHVNFETNSAVLMATSYPELDKVVAFLLENPEVKIMIGGHTDNAGVHDNNMILSENRAKAVMDYLISKNIEAPRMQAKGFGEMQPLVDNDSPENMAVNRRVEFTITEE